MTQIDPFIIKICKQIATATNRSIIEFNDAKWLSGELAQKKVFVSPHTLGRLYGMIKPYRKPYKETLNCLAAFLEYANWEEYVANQTTLHTDPNFFLTESQDGFSQSVLELALITRDYEAVSRIIQKYESIEINNTFFSTAVIIGVYLKTNNYEKELLYILAQSKQGHSLFYECFVDEDNTDNYFSEALLLYYLPTLENPYRKLYVYTYCISQMAYKENCLSTHYNSFLALLPELTIEKCHFHEASRCLECLIIYDGFNERLAVTWQNHLDHLLVFCVGKENTYWLLYRSIKALLHFGYKKELFQHVGLNKLVETIIKSNKSNFNTIALYGLQLYWLCKERTVTVKQIYNPYRIAINYFHTDNAEKLAIEFATASLFAAGENNLFLEKHVANFCKQNGKQWVLNLIKG